MAQTKQLFDRCGGYRRLYSFTFATMIHLETIAFCKRFIPWQEDQLGKIAGQMIGAARSGRQNIIEGSARSATSKETEIKLTDVARASLAELLGDYEIFLATRNSIPWSRNNEKSKKVFAVMLPEFYSSNDSLHDYWQYYHNIRPLFASWLGDNDCTIVANTMIILILRTMAMLSAQIKTQGSVFVEDGGFRERMYKCHTDSREQKAVTENSDLTSPECPECGKKMRKRHSKRGEFWGCSAYPECKGIRSI
jgi:four helix bundle suffix protein